MLVALVIRTGFFQEDKLPLRETSLESTVSYGNSIEHKLLYPMSYLFLEITLAPHLLVLYVEWSFYSIL